MFNIKRLSLHCGSLAKNLWNHIGRHPVTWYWLWIMSGLSIFDIPAHPAFGMSEAQAIIYTILVSSLKASALTLLYSLMQQRLCTRIIAVVMIILFSLVAVANAFSFVFYENGITRKTILVCFQTTKDETLGFLPSVIENAKALATSAKTLIITVITLGIGVLFAKMPSYCFRSITGFMTLTGMILFIGFCFMFPFGRSAHLLTARILKYSFELHKAEQEFNSNMAELRAFPDKQTASSTHIVANVIVVIGESASRNHHSLYGYPIPTTPRLSAMKDSLIVFNNVIGSSNGTSGNMERILTFKNDDETDGDGTSFPAIIDLFKTVGYKTFWLSNQERAGLMSNTGSVLSSMADVIKYVGADNSEDVLASRFDDVLLPYAHEALTDTAANKLVFIHLLGSHVQYSHRYPQEFAVITAEQEMEYGPSRPWLNISSAQTVAEYDNSIYFTDFVISSLINSTAALRKPSVLIYFSDHGENVYDEGNYSGRGRKYVEVPFIIYMNKAYRDSRPDMASQAERAVNYPVSTANIIYPMMTLTGTSYIRYDSIRDFLSPDFGFLPRYVDESIWNSP